MIVGYREDGAWWKDKIQRTEAGLQVIRTDISLKKKIKSHEGDQTPEHILQRGCGVSILREIQNSPEHGPEQPPLTEHALRRKLDRRPPGVPFHPLWLNDQQNISK